MPSRETCENFFWIQSLSTKPLIGQLKIPENKVKRLLKFKLNSN